MHYRKDKHGENLSILGFGCMRFQRKRGNIDFEEAEREILSAIDQGVNYFDTAYIYPGSEELLGAVLDKNHCRDQVNIATKLPHYLIRKPDDIERFFQEQLRRLRTDHIDYYLMHMLPDVTTWERLKGLGVEQWLQEKQAAGVIRNVGFSYHGNTNAFQELLDSRDWDFCQIQYNYIDEQMCIRDRTDTIIFISPPAASAPAGMRNIRQCWTFFHRRSDPASSHWAGWIGIPRDC